MIDIDSAMAKPPMSFSAEMVYLTELEVLAQVMSTHATSLMAARSKWIDVHGKLQARLSTSPTPKGTAAVVGEKLKQQWALWLPLESFLTAWARASLLLFPAKKNHSACARGAYLRGVLNIHDDHLLSNRDLRNDWMHFDERLDSAIASCGQADSQRFERELARNGRVTVRTIIMEPFSVCFFGGSPQQLEPMFSAATGLREQVGLASRDIGQRNPPE